MKGKGSLALMEQIVMLLVFALAAALCLQAFVKSDQLSRRSEAADHAAVLCQSVAETICHNGGDLKGAMTQVNGAEPLQRDGFGWFEGYNEDWEVLNYEDRPVSSSYTLRVMELDSGVDGLGKANVEAYIWNGGTMESLFALEFSWQEEVTAAIPQEDKNRARQEAETLLREIRGGGENVLSERTLAGETDGLGGWCRYFDQDWNIELSYSRAVFTLWYSGEKVTASWNETDENGFVTGVNVLLCTMEQEEVTAHG